MSAPLPSAQIGPTSVGLIGIGLMGEAIARRLADQGVDLLLYNRTPEKARAVAAALASTAAGALSGAASAGSGRPQRSEVVAYPRDTAAARLIGLVVTDESATRAVLQGENGLLSSLSAQHTVVHFGTIGPRAARSIAAEVARTGAHYLDAPVLGSTDAAGRGELLLFAGGEPPTVDRARPLTDAIARKVFVTGPVGSASSVKLIANMLLARYVEALGETLALAEKFELDPLQLLEVLQSSALASPMWEKGRALLVGPMPLHFPMEHMGKDLRLLDEEVERLGLSLPGHEAVKALFEEAIAAGMKGQDYSEIARFIARETPRRAP